MAMASIPHHVLDNTAQSGEGWEKERAPRKTYTTFDVQCSTIRWSFRLIGDDENVLKTTAGRHEDCFDAISIIYDWLVSLVVRKVVDHPTTREIKN